VYGILALGEVVDDVLARDSRSIATLQADADEDA
jgi:hypothetical protein